MYKIGFIVFSIWASWSKFEDEAILLTSLKQAGQITAKEYKIFKRQIDFKATIGTLQRLDSLENWNLDIVYTEETYYPQKDSFLVKEYYFSQKKWDTITVADETYSPDRYYENGILKERYFFSDPESREHLHSIISHMKERKPIDEIIPLARIEVLHAGCGMAWKTMEVEEAKAERKYKKARTPGFYLIETLEASGNKKISFQRPVRSVYSVIVEGHSF